MNHIEAINYINDKNKFGSRLGLDSISKLLDLLGNPQDKLNIIHVAGTNGKGSTSSYLTFCMLEAGYDVGLFTSPFLERFNERIKINDKDIANEDLGRITALVKKAVDKMLAEGLDHPTTFEIVTAIAFVYFEENNLDYVVLEVGLGGRYDSTNVIKNSLASIITTIGIDHIEQLGDSLGEIAYQKAGIIKDKGLVVSYPQEEEVKKVIEDITREKNGELYFSDESFIDILDENDSGNSFNYKYKDTSIKNIRTSMVGEYQIYNSALAITTLLILRDKGLIKIKDEEIVKGIFKTRWNGRLEVLKRNPTILIDGAHNVQSVDQLRKALELFDYENLILGLAILGDKDVDHILELLIPMADKVIVTEVDMPRKLEAENLKKKVEKYRKDLYIEKEIGKAVDKSLSLAQDKDLIVFGGSLYLIGEVRSLINSL